MSEWGHDFRPSYLALANTIVSILKTNVPIISLTATASNNVLENIKIELNIASENVIYRMHNSRPELNYKIIKTSNKNKNLDSTINKMINDKKLSDNDAGIVFTMHVNGELVVLMLNKILIKIFRKLNQAFFVAKFLMTGLQEKKKRVLIIIKQEFKMNIKMMMFNLFAQQNHSEWELIRKI